MRLVSHPTAPVLAQEYRTPNRRGREEDSPAWSRRRGGGRRQGGADRLQGTPPIRAASDDSSSAPIHRLRALQGTARTTSQSKPCCGQSRRASRSEVVASRETA